MTSVDALVVGAGPAGSIAALLLARAGVRVRLIDRATFPRHKLCGDTLNPGALAALESLSTGNRRGPDLAAGIRDRSLPIDGMTVSGPDGAQVTGRYPRSLRGAALTRDVLDLLLLEAASAAGAVFMHGVSARAPVLSAGGRVAGVDAIHRTGREQLSARMVILADGRGSRLASSLGLSAFARAPRRWAFGTYFTDVDGMTTFGEMHVRHGGYIGVAPLPRGLVNVCVVRTLRRGMLDAADPQRLILDAVAAEPLLRERFARARPAADVTTLGPLAVDARAAGMPGLVLAGDVAGFVDPMTGDGLRFALRGGILAAAAALSDLSTGQPAYRALSAARAREFSGKWRLNRSLRALSDSPRALAVVSAVSRRWPTPLQQLIGFAGDVGCVPRDSEAVRTGQARGAERAC